ncbi:hypothetical protein RvY_14989 [Ramazzottius varieornatus]|uniref:Uncharacterized protein n=1 Tax=Ramazzottius varieornatus TaxID=947166 RepID=A0A1D1VT91_RAMVA|nr:hypothetical protein RvY_14989 [Ramazzottius varieornatus]
MSDWLPTLYEAAGDPRGDLRLFNVTGLSHWSNFQEGTDHPVRTELLNNIDPLSNVYAMIDQQQGRTYKLIGGNTYGRTIPTWQRTEGTSEKNPMKKWTPTSVECLHTPGIETTACIPWVANCLYDLTADPCEQANIAAIAPWILYRMERKLAAYNQTAVCPGIQGLRPGICARQVGWLVGTLA